MLQNVKQSQTQIQLSLSNKMGTSEKVFLQMEKNTPQEISAMILQYFWKATLKTTLENITNKLLSQFRLTSTTLRQATKETLVKLLVLK